MARRVPLTPVWAVVSALAWGLLCATVVSAQPTNPAAVGKSTGQSRSEIQAYWTPARMASAKPRELAKGATGSPTSSKTSYTTSLVSDTERLSFPGSTNGKVYMTFGSTNYVCSGTAVASANKSTVLTAGHCVWDNATAQYATNFLFVPAMSNNTAPFGTFAYRALYTTPQWRDNRNFSFDEGAAVVAANSANKALTDQVGGRTIYFNGPRDQAYTLYGYPANAKYSYGRYLYKCSTRYTGDDPYGTTTPKPIGVACDWPGGSSGGAWIGGTTNAISSLTSFGYSNLAGYVFGPYLGNDAASFYNTVQALNP